MRNGLRKSSVLAGVLMASCLLGEHTVLAEEVSLDFGLSAEVLP